jgi:hypothetical protein
MIEHRERCGACDRSSHEVPLLTVRYMGETVWICSQHLPVLIHNPQQLAGRLRGAERLQPADHTDHDAE